MRFLEVKVTPKQSFCFIGSIAFSIGSFKIPQGSTSKIMLALRAAAIFETSIQYNNIFKNTYIQRKS